jgi:hypothetical protein
VKTLKRGTSLRTGKVIVAPLEAIRKGHGKIVRHLAQQIGFSTTAAWKISRDDLLLLPYKMQPCQPLWEYGIVRHEASGREFGALLDGGLY